MRQFERVIENSGQWHTARTSPRRQLARQRQYALSLLYVCVCVCVCVTLIPLNVRFMRGVTCNELA
jgi:hypothetical protein